MVQLKNVCFGVLLMMAVILLIGVSSVSANHNEDEDDTPYMIGGVPDYMRSTQDTINFMDEGWRLAEKCKKEGKGSKSCKAFDNFKQNSKKIDRMLEDYTAHGEAINRQNEIYNSIRNGERSRMYRDDLRGYKNELNAWREDLKAAERAGNRKAAAEAQRKISFYESKVKEYSK
jgi:hypothetical protein